LAIIVQAGLEADFGLVILKALIGASSVDALVRGVVAIVGTSAAGPGAECGQGVSVIVGGTVAGGHTEPTHRIAEQIIGN
jgi:hypothetical protein